MSHSLSSLLLLYARQFEDQHAPQNMTIALREAGDEIDRLTAENERLKAALTADNQTLRLAMGEVTAQDMRNIRAAFGWVLSHAALTQEPRT